VAISKTAENWSILDAHLADRNYITGTSLTMADIPLGVTAYHWFNLDIERPPLGCCVFVCVLTVTRTVTIFLQTKLRTMALILLLHRRRVARSAGLEPATF
jgi:glutathione S-transferase